VSISLAADGIIRFHFRLIERMRYAKHFRRSQDAVIRVYDAPGNVIETHEHEGDFKEWRVFVRIRSPRYGVYSSALDKGTVPIPTPWR
jgi:hypothetical protein